MDEYDGPAEVEQAQMSAMMGARITKPTPLEQLKYRKAELESHLANVNAAIDALEKNPEVNKILELLSRTSLGLR